MGGGEEGAGRILIDEVRRERLKERRGNIVTAVTGKDKRADRGGLNS